MWKGLLIFLGFGVISVATGGIAAAAGASAGLAAAIGFAFYGAMAGGARVAIELSEAKRQKLTRALKATKRLNEQLEKAGIELRCTNTSTGICLTALKAEVGALETLNEQQKHEIEENIKQIEAGQSIIDELQQQSSSLAEQACRPRFTYH